MNIKVQVFLQIRDLIFPEYTPRSRIVGSYGIVLLHFSMSCQIVSVASILSYILNNNIGGFQFLLILPSPQFLVFGVLVFILAILMGVK